MDTTLLNIVTALVTMLIGFFCSEIYNSIVKPAWSKTNINQNRKTALRRIVRYSLILMAIACSTAFMSLNKFWVLFTCLSFSILVIFFIYDYTISVINGIAKLNKDDKKQQRRKYLYGELSYCNDKERRAMLIKELKELD